MNSRNGLTAKQAAFVREYLVDFNATQSAIRAGYSKRTAGALGHENLNKPEIRTAIVSAIDDRASRTELTQDEVIEGLRREASFEGDGASHGARVSALSWLGRHLAMFTDRVSVLQKLEHMSSKELEALLELPGEELVKRLGNENG